MAKKKMAKKKMDNDKVNECLSGINYPADKEAVVQHVKKTCGDENLASMIKDLPSKTYDKAQVLTSELRSVLPGIRVDIL